MQQLWYRVRDAAREAQEKQQADADRLHQPNAISFEEGELVLLHTRNYPALRKSKLHGPFVGPFKITKVLSPATVELDLPQQHKIHPIVNVENIKKYTAPLNQPKEPGPIGKTAAGEELFELERIVGSACTGTSNNTACAGRAMAARTTLGCQRASWSHSTCSSTTSRISSQWPEAGVCHDGDLDDDVGE